MVSFNSINSNKPALELVKKNAMPLAALQKRPLLPLNFLGELEYQRSLSLTTAPKTDIFQISQPKHARIVLFSDTDMSPWMGKYTEASPAAIISGIAEGFKFHHLLQRPAQDEDKAQGQLYKEDVLGEFHNIPAMFIASTEKNKKKAAEQDLRAMVSAFEKAFSRLPEQTEAVTIVLPPKLPSGLDRATLLRELATRSVSRGYHYAFTNKGAEHPWNLNTVTISKVGKADVKLSTASAGLAEGQRLGEAMNLTRLLVDAPANIKNTGWISDRAYDLSSPTLKVNAYDAQWLSQQHMGLFLSVAQGHRHDGHPLGDKVPLFDNSRQPRLLEMIYTPPSGKFDKTILLVGKGIIFDTGGNNLKTSEYMHNMRGDMAGAAAVMGTMKMLDMMKPEGIRVVGLGALTENRISGHASLPDDVYEARATRPDGTHKTARISNTDAEGRLVLADAIHYGMETYKPDLVADIATLTGGKVRGLGEQNSVAISGNNLDLMKHADTLEKGLGYKTAVLELNDAHHRWVTHNGRENADVLNSVGLGEAYDYGVLSAPFERENKSHMLQHSAQGAAFIREFLYDPKTPWIHYDIAGAEFEPRPELGAGVEKATGFGVPSLYLLVKSVAEGKFSPNRDKSLAVGEKAPDKK